MLALILISLVSTASGTLGESSGANTSANTPYKSIRYKRPLMLGAEIGINGLTGFGTAVSYTFNNAWSLDAAAGVSAQLMRGGVRGRYNFLPTAVSPFLGIGVLYGLGTPYDLKGFQGNKTVVYHIAGAPFGQAVAGILYNHRKGFTIMGSLGWVQLLTRGSNVIVDSGNLSDNQLRGIRLAAGSGMVASVTTGYSF